MRPPRPARTQSNARCKLTTLDLASPHALLVLLAQRLISKIDSHTWPRTCHEQLNFSRKKQQTPAQLDRLFDATGLERKPAGLSLACGKWVV